ncbi:ATP-binding protein [Magnetospirillum moscoviense]|uniref:histidine kinase n=1 Tax=Magnetospirillum moscoviense TaxID=1437059 RepID=A0A178MJ45_9PROT|nr:ATP-binding protein [Magnetospirillum moscoviense]OAN48751.1 hypothetical protein A6A05_14645 [Magnetospirillum moscoviense]
MSPRRAIEPAIFLAAYVFLDQISFIHSISHLSITPWNPPAGLAMAFLLIRGVRWTPLVFMASLLADFLIRTPTTTILPAFLTAATIAGFYGLLVHILRRPLGLDISLHRLRDVLLLNVGAAFASLAVAVLYVGTFVWFGQLDPARFTAATTRFWIGDMIGIAVMTPLLLVAYRFVPRWPSPRRLAEAALQGLTIVAMVWLVFGFRAADEFRLFYLLFLPMIWASVRFGLDGAVLANLATQGALIIAIQSVGHESTTVTAFQLLMLVLALASLALGAAVAEGRRTAAALQARQVELAHISRLSLAGEMAAALAHELNQPLMATMAFARAAQRLLDNNPEDSTKARAAMGRAVDEAQRAGDIVKSLRQFIGQDRLTREMVPPARLIADALALVAPEAKRLGIRLAANPDKSAPDLAVDRVQVQQVLVNLIHNALDAMVKADSVDPSVTVSAESESSAIVFEVADGGPGIAPDIGERLFEPFNTSKATGMGLGLSICRTLVEAHGGTIWLERTGPTGTSFRFRLPFDPTEKD